MKKVIGPNYYDPEHKLTDEEMLAWRILQKRHIVTLEILEPNERSFIENGEHKTSNVDPKKFGGHKYADDGTSDCAYGCGCWMGPTRSGGKVDPFGPCPNNPKKRGKK